MGETPGAREAFRRQVKQLRREQLRSVEQFEREFGRVMNDYVVKRGKRLVVFIDDLDRCLPERAIQVLEALKLFLCVRGGVFILGLDREAIEAAIATRFGEEFPTCEYFEKMIQVQFLLPPIESSAMTHYLPRSGAHIAR